MRHRKSGKQLGRNSSHRKSMFKNMTCSLLEHELIKTTLPKAKALRRCVEPLITLAKTDSVANRRLAFAQMGNKAVLGKLFNDLGSRYQDRPGGYTRILKCNYRPGDAAPMALVELVGRPLPDDDSDLPDSGAPDLDTPIKTLPEVAPSPQAEKESWFGRVKKKFLKQTG